MELFKDIQGYEGIYQIGNLGTVRRVLPNNQFRPLKHILAKVGYYMVSLSVKCKIKRVYIHRLISDSWLPNPENHNYINHLNGKKTDNRLENLEWCTQSRNIQHSFDTGLQPNGEQHHANTKLTKEQVLAIRNDYNHLGDRAVGKIFGIDHGFVYRIRKLKCWKHI